MLSDTPPAGDHPARRSRTSGHTVVAAAALVVIVLAGAVTAVTVLRRPSSGPPGLANAPEGLNTSSLQDRPAPGERFRLPSETLEAFGDGQPVATDALIGQPLVVNFWATWCAPCVREMPDLQRVADDLDGQVTFLGVNVMDAPSNAESFATRLGVSYTLATDRNGDYWRATRSFGMPTTLLADRDGTVVYRHTGELDAAQLRTLIQSHLGVDATANAGFNA